MKVTRLGFDPDLARKVANENNGVIAILGQENQESDATDEVEEDSEEEARQYLMEEGLPITAQSLHDAAQMLHRSKNEPDQNDAG
jgi:hypothetical protein